jgi:hypothetical protein
MSIGVYLGLGDVRPRKVGLLTAQAVTQYDLIGLSSGNAVRAEDESWASAVATPSAPTVANGAVAVGSPLTNALTNVKVSIMFPWGEGALSAAGNATPTAAALLKVTLAALPAPGLYWCIYVEDAAGSGVYKLWGTSHTGSIVMVDSYGLGRVPPSAVLSGATEISQYNFAQKFMGLAHQTKAANAVRCYGSSEDNKLIVHPGGCFLADCASATFAVGDAVGPAKQSGNALESQKLVGVADISLGVGYCIEAGTSITTVKFEVVSKKDPMWRQPLFLGA